MIRKISLVLFLNTALFASADDRFSMSYIPEKWTFFLNSIYSLDNSKSYSYFNTNGVEIGSRKRSKMEFQQKISTVPLNDVTFSFSFLNKDMNTDTTSGMTTVSARETGNAGVILESKIRVYEASENKVDMSLKFSPNMGPYYLPDEINHIDGRPYQNSTDFELGLLFHQYKDAFSWGVGGSLLLVGEKFYSYENASSTVPKNDTTYRVESKMDVKIVSKLQYKKSEQIAFGLGLEYQVLGEAKVFDNLGINLGIITMGASQNNLLFSPNILVCLGKYFSLQLDLMVNKMGKRGQEASYTSTGGKGNFQITF